MERFARRVRGVLVICVYLGVVICMVGSRGLVESIWGCPGAYLELLLVSVVRRGPHDGSGEFSQNVAILG